MLDFDLAALYETETKRLKEAVGRNSYRDVYEAIHYLLQKDEQPSKEKRLVLKVVSKIHLFLLLTTSV